MYSLNIVPSTVSIELAKNIIKFIIKRYIKNIISISLTIGQKLTAAIYPMGHYTRFFQLSSNRIIVVTFVDEYFEGALKI